MSVLKWMSDSQKVVSDWLGDLPRIHRWLVYGGVATCVGMLGAAKYMYSNPDRRLQWNESYLLRSAGFSVKFVEGRTYRYCYAERGQLRSDQPSLLFVDRLDGGKVNWMLVCKDLPKDIHIVCVDLPGQGDSTVPTDLNEASLYKLTQTLAEFAALLNLDVIRHHVVGLSLGGTVAALYAATYPENVSKLTLIAPLIQCSIETDFWATTEDTEPDPYLTDDPEQMKEEQSRFYYNTKQAPQALWTYKALTKRRQNKKEFLRQLLSNLKTEVTKEASKFENLLSKIRCPVQVIWGEEDEIVHVSGALNLEELIPNVKQTSILPKCGHFVYSDQREVVRRLITDFYYST